MRVSQEKYKLDAISRQQLDAFERFKYIVASEDVISTYPDFKKTFGLTTDVSAHGLVAVLSQDGRPITLISRTLRKNNTNVSINECKLVVIVWALENLCNYLYGVRSVNILTDPQPLTCVVSEKIPNAKKKRWKFFNYEHNDNHNLLARQKKLCC